MKLMSIVLLLTLSWGTFTATASTYQGIDVSVWQGDIDFSRVKADGKELVYIRAGYGLTEDSYFRINASNAKDAGLKIGFYLYVTARNLEQAQEQADYFAKLISEYAYDCRPAIDFESYGALSRQEIIDIAVCFAERLNEKTGEVPLFYTDASGAADRWGDRLVNYPLWVADYGVSSPYSIGSWSEWAGFQYADNGRVSGISGKVDLNDFTDMVLLQEPTPFVDVSREAWYEAAIKTVYDQGLMSGITATQFEPFSPSTRAMMMQVLYRMAGSPSNHSGMTFNDIPTGAWYRQAVLWNATTGIAKGDGDALFFPKASLTREDMAVFLYRYAQRAGLDVSTHITLEWYSDGDDVSVWAVDAMEWAVEQGMILGTGEKTLDPTSAATRAELAQVLSRYLTR